MLKFIPSGSLKLLDFFWRAGDSSFHLASVRPSQSGGKAIPCQQNFPGFLAHPGLKEFKARADILF